MSQTRDSICVLICVEESETTLMQSENVSEWILDGELVVQDALRRRLHVLNPTAAHVWYLCDGERCEDDIVQEIASFYEQPRDHVAPDVYEVIQHLRQEGLLRE